MENIPIASDYPADTGRRRRRRRASPIVRVWRGIRAILILGLIVSAAYFIYTYVTSPTTREAVHVLATHDYTPSKAFPDKKEVNVLLMGRDLDRDERGQIVNTRGRTDAMMLAHFDFEQRTVSILSIPRDTLVHIPGYRGKRRISYANAYGGTSLAVDTVREFTGVTPDYYSLINFQGFEKGIDAIGGLDINVDKQLDYDDNWGNLHIHLKPGLQKLNGYESMGFVRYRHANGGGGDSDLVRIGRQQEFIRAAKAKLASPGVAVKIPAVLDIVRGEMRGDLTPAQMMCLACFVKSLSKENGLRMETIPTIEGGGAFVRADIEGTKKLVTEMFLD